MIYLDQAKAFRFQNALMHIFEVMSLPSQSKVCFSSLCIVLVCAELLGNAHTIHSFQRFLFLLVYLIRYLQIFISLSVDTPFCISQASRPYMAILVDFVLFLFLKEFLQQVCAGTFSNLTTSYTISEP